MALEGYLAEEIAQDCADGLLSRRGALRRLALLGLSVPAAGILLAARSDAEPQTTPGASRLFQIPPTIADDGSKDVTTDILHWLDDAVPNGEMVNGKLEPCIPFFNPEGVYRCEGTLAVPPGRYGLLFATRGCTFLRTTTDPDRRAQWDLNHCERITWGPMRLQGPAPVSEGYRSEYERQHGITLRSSNFIQIRDLIADGVWGDKVYMSAAPDTKTSWTDDVTIISSKGGYSHRHMLGIVGARNVRIMFNDFGRCARTYIDLEPNGTQGGADNIWIEGNSGWQALNWIASLANEGNVTNVTALKNQSNKISMVVGGDCYHANFDIEGNQGFESIGTNSGAIMNFGGIHKLLRVVDNHEPMNTGRVTGLPMRMARSVDPPADQRFIYEGNTEDIG